MSEITVGQYLALKAQEKIFFNGLQWYLQKNYKPFQIAVAAMKLKSIRDEIQTIELNLRNMLNKKKKTIAQATA